MSSAFLRQHISYPELNEKECTEIIAICTTLLEWLREHQIEECDFIRQTIIESLENFIFRIKHLQWLGWGYSLESLKAVVMAYIALERGNFEPSEAPTTAAMIKKVGSTLKKCFEIVGVSKDAFENADFALKAYGALMLTFQAGGKLGGFISG